MSKKMVQYIKLPSPRVIKFLISGGSAALAEFLIFGVLNRLGFIIVIANTISFLVAAVISFTLNKKWVFKSEGKTINQFSAYITLAVINLFLSNILVLCLAHGLNLWPLLAKFITMALIAAMNYLLFSKLIFRTPTK